MTKIIPTLLFALVPFLISPLAAKQSNGENTILFYGNSMIERLLEHGEMEARLQIAQPKAGLKIRSLAWTGDEVGNRLRLEGYAKHMKNLLAEWPANTIVLGYGLNESFAGEKGLADFHQQYTAHLNQLGRTHPGAHIVMLSPIAVEGATEQRQAAVELYSKAIAKLASEHKASFVDLFALTRQAYASSDKKLTTNGIHLNESGNQFVAKKLAKALAPSGSDTVNIDPKHLHEVALAASAKHRRVAEVVRVKNGVVYFGVRARPAEYAAEMPRYHEMIRLTDAVVHQLAADPKKTFASIPAPSLPPMPEGRGRDDGNKTGIIKTVAQNQAEFKTAEGYEVSLFASEEEFPELRNPVQIAFDARGRLWVVTMPSFPHTVPGLTPPDKIIILEDTDGDGKADKLTPYLEGLDALDGITFHHDGVIISEQPRLWLTQDSNGDDRADNQSELLRGIDVTDSHHGGMIQSDPLGALIFSDGVFHRSQFETKFGVHRAMDASTYRLDMQTGGIITEWQHTTPNPWNVTFDRWGNIFQMYGDGDVYDGTSLIWTPFGAYHPYAYARMTSYGKGSGCAMISSPNFPDEYQNGIASASLLGRYAITLTKLDRSGGMVKRKDSLTILESPNAAFRPADIEFAMDGSLYISDFCSPIIGHAQHPMRDPHWDHDYGRIWRVVHTKKPLQKEQPQIEGATVQDLCGLLTHTQDLVRHHARIELRKHGAKGLQAVDYWIASFDKNDPGYDQAALEALFVCEGLGETRPALLDHLLKSKSELFRGAAVHVIRIQADRLSNVKELLTSVVSDPHPRVQLEVIDAVAHLRVTNPDLESILTNLTSTDPTIKKSLATLALGTEPAKGRSVPVLEVDKASQLTNWLWLGNDGESAPVEMQVGKNKLPGQGHFRTFIHSEQAQPAIIAINNKNLEIKLNDSVVFEQNSFWSGDQQVNVNLQPGLNVIEINLRKGRRSAKTMPPVFLYDPVGQALTGAKYLRSTEDLRSTAAEYDKFIAERGNVLHIQAAPELQFAPKQLSVTPGSKVRLVFSNPDIMMHNWVLLTPGSVNEIGALADQLASQADGMEKGYLPESDKILVASKLLGPNAKEEIVFTAPSEPGDYPYICTFPGHWRIMQGVLTVAEKKTAKVPTETKPIKSFTVPIGKGLLFETSPSPTGFKKLVPPSKASGKITANQKTNNDPIATLSDGKIGTGFGPIFANGTKDGAYKIDLGKPQDISAITSWAHQTGGKRGAQTVTLFGSNLPRDPGWDLANTSKFTPLGTLSTKGQKLQNFTALSRRASKGKTLGNFRWIIWQVSPVTGADENTAFQELSVEIAPAKSKEARKTEKTEKTKWLIDSQSDWQAAASDHTNLEIKDGQASPTAKNANFRSKLKTYDEKRSAQSITVDQSPVWHNWEPTGQIGPDELGDAPIALRMGPNNYWLFGRYKPGKNSAPLKPSKLEGFDIPLMSTKNPHLFVAPGGLKKAPGGYSAWQSRDMVNWVFHGAVTPPQASMCTTAELVDGKLYLYYDYPNDQDPHLIIDSDLTDGLPGKEMGMAFADPSDGSDCAIIRDLKGNFHMILEDWSPINASTHAWDSPLAMHAVSKDGKGDFKILAPPVDERTKPTGKFAEYFHPHWHRGERKDEFPTKIVPEDIPQHRLKKGDKRAVVKYEIHEPEQNAYGDWAAISVGGQYYLFCDFDPIGGHGKSAMSVGWFTSSSIDQKFTFCGNIGSGHPDPDIIFAEDKFYLITQTKQDFVSPGPWINGVEVRVGVDTSNDGSINQWTDWQEVKETYFSIPGFAKQVAKTPAQLDLSKLPKGYGFQFEIKLNDTTENASKPILDKVTLTYQ